MENIEVIVPKTNDDVEYIEREEGRICIHVQSVDDIEQECEVEMDPNLQKKTQASSTDVDITQAWFTSKDDKESRKGQGQNWKTGQWTKDEVNILKKNVETYCEKHAITDPTRVIFDMQKEERKDFYRQCAKGLERPLFSVYRRLLRMYDKKNHMGKYSKEEVDRLRKLTTKYGKDWSKIGQEMGRSASSVKDKMRLLRESNTGKWMPEEEDRLVEAIQELQGQTTGVPAVHGIEWAKVADKVETRSEKQCRTKWLNYLSWKHSGGKEWSRDDDLKLLDILQHLKVDNDNDVNWTAIFQDWPSARSPQWLRAKWWSLKRHVNSYSDMKLPELIDNVKKQLQTRYNNSQPSLGGRLSTESENDASQTVSILTIPTLPPLIDNAVLLDPQSAPLNQSIILDQSNIVFDQNVIIDDDDDDDDDKEKAESDKEQEEKAEEIENEIVVTPSTVQQQFLIANNTLGLLTTSANNLRDHIVVHALPVNASNNLQQSLVFSNDTAVQLAPSVGLQDQEGLGVIDTDFVVGFNSDPI